jgi:hypothetical protein
MLETIRWAYEAAVERILRKRLQERYDSGFLAGIDTAKEAVLNDSSAANTGSALGAIAVAREGYLEEVASR